ncbi:hypothetical protein GCM10023189_50180 [Nibrella saemangeumensis]|uniref:Lipocalin-like domain-containing protein n=1 Tax=Nibrella saemangeumensis TaxID=1084526 RepID=A0ABP8NKZ8_9BACT
MVKTRFLSLSTGVSLSLLLAILACKDKPFTLGQGAPELVGTWRLVERADTRDTALVVRSIPATPEQSITFTAEGAVSSQGKELEYYRPARYYRREDVQPTPLVRFYVGEQHANFTQDFSLRNDTLAFLPRCERRCYLLFVRGR